MIANPVEFARAWAEAWNRRDVEAVLAHFHPAADFASPVARMIGFSIDGSVKGKEALRRYWTAALQRNPELRFEILDVYAGVDSLVMIYRTQDGARRAEVLIFEDGLASSGRGTFLAA